jgi:hypothetical protein
MYSAFTAGIACWLVYGLLPAQIGTAKLMVSKSRK